MMTEDLTVFFDTTGFSTVHTINGTPGVLCIVGDKITGRSEFDGAWIETLEVAVQKTAMTIPVPKQAFVLDSVRYTVDTIRDDGAVVFITISRPVS